MTGHVLRNTAALIGAAAIASGVVAAQFSSQYRPTPPRQEGRPSTAATATGVVTAVIDGDTIVVRVDGAEHRVRLLGINAQEVAHRRYGKPGQCGGQAARQAADEMLYRKTVTLTSDSREASTDRYGRWLRYVSVDGHDAGLLLIRHGHASEYHPRNARPEARAAEYRAAQKHARNRHRGQWVACRPDQVTMTPAR